MAPHHGIATDYVWLDKNRFSPRILNKKSTKLDISSVDNKIDFMRSLNLFCTSNENENKENSRKSLLKNNFKSCLILKNLKCDACEELFTNRADLENHNCQHHLVECNNNSIKNKHNTSDCACGNYMDSCHGKNVSTSLNKLKSNKRRRKSKDAKTKVTLKIGGEVISKVYCKNKYLDLTCSDQKSNGIHNSEDCKKCIEIKKMLQNHKLDTTDTSEDQSQTAKPENNIDRVRQMAALLVEQEVRRIAALESMDQEPSSDEESDMDCAVVPHSDTFKADEIQESFHITPENKSKLISCNQNINSITKDSYEVITIDDDSDDDRSINQNQFFVNKQSSHLMDPEVSYSFNFSDKNSENTNCLENVNTSKVQKQNKNFQDVTNKPGLGLPLRLVNF